MKKTFPSHFRRHFLVLSGSRGGGGLQGTAPLVRKLRYNIRFG